MRITARVHLVNTLHWNHVISTEQPSSLNHSPEFTRPILRNRGCCLLHLPIRPITTKLTLTIALTSSVWLISRRVSQLPYECILKRDRLGRLYRPSRLYADHRNWIIRSITDRSLGLKLGRHWIVWGN